MILVLHYIGVVLFKCQSSQIRCKNLLAFSEAAPLALSLLPRSQPLLVIRDKKVRCFIYLCSGCPISYFRHTQDHNGFCFAFC